MTVVIVLADCSSRFGAADRGVSRRLFGDMRGLPAVWKISGAGHVYSLASLSILSNRRVVSPH